MLRTNILFLISAAGELLQKLLFVIGKGLCMIVSALEAAVEFVSGTRTVTLGGAAELKKYLGNVNFIAILLSLALAGILACIIYAAAEIIKCCRKRDKNSRKLRGGKLKHCLKGIVLILLINLAASAAITVTSMLTDRINNLIVNAQSIETSYDITFDSDDYICMTRSLNTIGNYSLNASYNSRYNLNACYNEIRENLKQLADKGKLDVTYISAVYDENGESRTVNTWQSVLQAIYRSVDDISIPQPLDEYNAKLSEALLDAMSIIRNDTTFAALESYHVGLTGQSIGAPVYLDRMIMLTGSMYGSKGELDKGSGFTDYLRGSYYYGQRDLFSYSVCDKDFDMSLGRWMYLAVIIAAFLFGKEMLLMVCNAAARIVNILMLYVAAPPIMANVYPDGGKKLKQWTDVFQIQCIGLVGTVVLVRLVMIFIPVLFSGDIQLFDSVRLDIFARLVLVYAALFTARKAGGMIVAALADNTLRQEESKEKTETAEGRGRAGARHAGVLGFGAVRTDIAMSRYIRDEIMIRNENKAAERKTQQSSPPPQ